MRALILTIGALLSGGVSGFGGGNAFLLVGIGWPDPSMGTNMYFYDAQGHPTSYRFYSGDTNGTLELNETYTCDRQGHVLSYVSHFISFSPSNEFSPATSFFSDEVGTNTWEHGDLVRRETFETNYWDLFTFTNRSHSLQTNFWNNQHQPLLFLFEADNGNGRLTYRETVTWIYDKSSKDAIGSITSVDEDGNGVVDSVTRSSFQSDKNSQLSLELDETDYGLDGVTDFFNEIVIKYDQWGNDIEEDSTAWDSSGTVLGTGTMLLSYVRRGEVVGNSPDAVANRPSYGLHKPMNSRMLNDMRVRTPLTAP